MGQVPAEDVRAQSSTDCPTIDADRTSRLTVAANAACTIISIGNFITGTGIGVELGTSSRLIVSGTVETQGTTANSIRDTGDNVSIEFTRSGKVESKDGGEPDAAVNEQSLLNQG